MLVDERMKKHTYIHIQKCGLILSEIKEGWLDWSERCYGGTCFNSTVAAVVWLDSLFCYTITLPTITIAEENCLGNSKK